MVFINQSLWWIAPLPPNDTKKRLSFCFLAIPLWNLAEIFSHATAHGTG